MTETICDILRENAKLESTIDIYDKSIDECKRKILENERRLFRECKHSWTTEPGIYDHSSDVCKYCKLYNNEYMYKK